MARGEPYTASVTELSRTESSVDVLVAFGPHSSRLTIDLAAADPQDIINHELHRLRDMVKNTLHRNRRKG